MWYNVLTDDTFPCEAVIREVLHVIAGRAKKGEALMINLTLQDGKLLVELGSEPPRTWTLRLNTLRKVFLFMPRKYRWHCAETTVDHSAANLDDLSAEEHADLLVKLSELEAGRDKFDLLLEDYVGHCLILSLADVDASGINLLAELGEHRRERRQKALDWTRHGPGLIITGVLGDSATLGPQGVRSRHTDPYMPWTELDRVEVERDSGAGVDAYRFVPKPGGVGHEFTVRMPAQKAEPFMAEYTFWHSQALRQVDGLA